MEEQHVRMIEGTNIANYPAQTVYVLGLCLILCVLLVLRRSTRHALLPDAEIAMSEPLSTYSDMQKPYNRPGDHGAGAQQAHLTDLFGSFPERTYMDTGPLTSGYLAAKADIEVADKLHAEREKQQHQQRQQQQQQQQQRKQQGAAIDIKVEANRVPMKQDESHRRASYPQTSDARASLHAASNHDDTEHSLDSHDPNLIWRRRTMIFLGRA
ncbi:hypothetical protein A1O1_07791 [Capronia coronata CBS 617.96]|uniref:Uncharacterized protein n=1 Tax=Capronia coronata CBS 617.96 TaxID=1182541 RepID=W9XXL8_9EURO|nr:uncharacterized protein A1O1_07791 [Capronia coronata CBS 617.96]EXJ81726.1 hypothetical protein A1O1_07791 [Capronia coronata CBS 617.96]